jgi:ABC-type multidrug transport system fused ATPase/permease subunit
MLKRIFAVFLVLILVGLYVATFILGISGSEYFAGMMFLCVVIPVFFWAVSLVTKLLRMKGKELQAEKQQLYEETEEENS